MAKYTKEEIYNKISEILVSDFEIKKEDITLQANLFEDLDFDSIDAVDLAVRLQQYVNKKITPEEFKQIRTVEDVVNTIESIL